MKKILFLATGVAMFASSAALAADAVEYIPETPAAVEMPAAFSWSGPYLGVHGGYGWGTGESAGFDESFDGGRFGGFVGYNWQMSNGFVAGIERDVNYDWNEETVAFGTGTAEVDTGFSGSVRGRLGYAMDRTLIYAAGGWTATEVNADAGAAGSFDDTLHGWTLGAGVEHAFTDNMIGRLQRLRQWQPRPGRR